MSFEKLIRLSALSMNSVGVGAAEIVVVGVVEVVGSELVVGVGAVLDVTTAGTVDGGVCLAANS